METAGLGVLADHILKAGLVYRNLASPELLYLVPVYVDTGHVDAHLRKTGSGDEADISRAHYRYFHTIPCSSIAFATFMKPAMFAPFT